MVNRFLIGDGITEYKSLALRNGGNAADGLKFKDAWLQERLSGLNFATQESKPAIVYLNGEYWGICCLQNKNNEDYFEDHYGVEDIVMIKEDELEEGEAYDLYEDFKAMADLDLRDPENWALFKESVDIQSMADYFAAQIYIGNGDWLPTCNIEPTISFFSDRYASGS